MSNDESSITKKVTPQTMPKGKRDVFIKSDNHSSEVVVGEPTFLEVPKEVQRATGKKRLNILKVLQTPEGCPFGIGLKAYVLEAGYDKSKRIVCVCCETDFKWMIVETEQISKMFPDF